MKNSTILKIVFAVIAFVIVIAILLVFHQEIVSCDKGDHSYHTKFPKYEIQDPAEIPIGSGFPSNWSYIGGSSAADGYEHENGRYKINGSRMFNHTWAVQDFVKLRIEAQFDQLTSMSIMMNDGSETYEVDFTPDHLPQGIFHEPELQYGFDVRPDGDNLVIRRLYNSGDITPDTESFIRMSSSFKHLTLKITDSTITKLSVYWTDEVPGIQGLLGL